jgi:long-subunit acyl-CoA synthetase (AMP-forming)
MTVRVKRLGIWEEAAELPFDAAPSAADHIESGDELVVVDPDDATEQAWLAGALERGAAVNVGDHSSTVLSDLLEVQPTVFRARADVWVALRAHLLRRAGSHPARLFRAKRRVRRAIGLGRVRRAESVGPLDAASRDWFARLGIEIQAGD